MSDENPLDAAFRIQQLDFERERAPAQRELDKVVRLISESQALRENGFGAELLGEELIVHRDEYRIKARVDGPRIRVSISKEGASNYERSMFGALSLSRDEAASAEAVIEKIGSLMARVVEKRWLF